jgi:hypothetical protein
MSNSRARSASPRSARPVQPDRPRCMEHFKNYVKPD